MFKISSHICEEMKNSDVELERLELFKSEQVLELIKKKYVDCNYKGEWLWEGFFSCKTLQDNNAWQYLKDFVRDNECIMFFNQRDEKAMFKIKSGKDLNYILSETYGFEFYITDIKATYLLCFNHHNILYGCGEAEEWISNIKSAVD